MLGKHMKFLAEVADLARLDFEAASITLKTKGDKLYSRYRGAYSSGQRWLTAEDIGEELPQLDLAVSAVQFKSLVGLFNEELPLSVIIRGNAVRMEGSGSRIDLATRSEIEDLEDEEKVAGNLIIDSRIDLLQKEFEVASEFAARSMASPILTGLRVSSEGGGLLSCEASDGYCLYVSEFAVADTGKFDAVLQAYDTVLGLKLLHEGTVKAYLTENGNLTLLGERSMFRSGIVRGNWPATERIRADFDRQDPIIIPSSIIRSLVQSVRILGTSNDLVLKGDGETLFLQTTASESGAFQASIPAKIEGQFIYDVSYYLLALNLGAQLTISIPTPDSTRSSTYLECDHRHFWMGQRIYSSVPMEPAGAVLQQD